MGKRRNDDEDEVSLKKRRKREDSNGEIAATHETPEKKKRKSKVHELEKNGKSNGNVSFGGEEDQFDAYLIRFPKTISVEDVHSLLPLKSKVKSRTKTKELPNGKEYTVCVAPNDTVMYHVPSVDGQLTGGNRITGTVTITEQKEMEEESHFVAHHDFLEDPPADIEMPFVIKPIKRKPVLELDGLKQRLHAYGCKSADSEQTPRKVKKAKRKSKRADDDE